MSSIQNYLIFCACSYTGIGWLRDGSFSNIEKLFGAIVFGSSGAFVLLRNHKVVSWLCTGIATGIAVVRLVRKMFSAYQEAQFLAAIKKNPEAFVQAKQELQQDRAAVLRLAQQVPMIQLYSAWKEDLDFFKEVVAGVASSENRDARDSLLKLIKDSGKNANPEWMVVIAQYYNDVFSLVDDRLLTWNEFVIACINTNSFCWVSLPEERLDILRDKQILPQNQKKDD